MKFEFHGIDGSSWWEVFNVVFKVACVYNLDLHSATISMFIYA